MSKLNTDTLGNAADSKSIPVDTIVAGSAKAWVNFNGTGTVAIRDSFNVSSITDNGVGDYTVNFTSAMPNANFCPLTSAGGAANIITGSTPNIQRTVNDVGIRTYNSSTSTGTDAPDATVAVFSN